MYKGRREKKKKESIKFKNYLFKFIFQPLPLIKVGNNRSNDTTQKKIPFAGFIEPPSKVLQQIQQKGLILVEISKII